ncbi:MAG: hypothetical protein WB789_05595 [Thermoplasmata archaeon]
MAHFSWSAAALVIAAVTLLTLPGSLASAGAGPGGFPSPGAGPSSPIGPNENATLTLEAGHNLSSLFWGTTVSPRARLLPNEGSLTTGTPVSVVVWPGAFAGDDYDPLANDARGVIWTSGNQQTTPSVNESQFVAWCRAINCTAIFQVPGEIDNPSIAADIVAYTVNQTYTGPVWEGGTEVNVTMPGLDFRPAYWEVGNEPALWPFWDEPWGEWNHYQTPDSAQYAHEENAYFLAMDGANRSYRPGIIGLPGIGKASSLDNPSQWIDDVLSLNGPNLSGVATHIYPARTLLSGQNALVQFYDQIGATDDSSLYARVGDFEVPILAACRTYTCGPDANASLPIFITEVGTSLSHSSFGDYSLSFPGALGMAVEGIQAMSLPNATVASSDLFQSVADTTNGWFNNSGAARPTYTLYTRIFSHLGTDVFPVNVTGDSNLSAIATVAASDGDRRDLLVANYNLTTSATFGTGFINQSSFGQGSAPLPTFAPEAPVEVWEWNATPPAFNHTVDLTTSDPATPVPVATYYDHGLPSSWTLPPQSLALFETYNALAYPVNFTANLTPPGSIRLAHWFIDVDGWRTSSTEASLTLLLRPGEHSAFGVPLLTPATGTDPKSRWNPYLPPVLTVGNSWTWVNITFARQWALNLSWNASRGTVLTQGRSGATGLPPDGQMSWVNDSEPINLTFQPSPGYAFDRWDGEGGGSFSGYSPMATLAPTSPLEEQAIFHPGTEVTFRETGLPAGTPWSVSLRGFEQNTANPTDVFYEVNGSWADQVNNVSGYQLITPGQGAWWQNTLVVANTSMTVPVLYTALTPPAPFYPVTFTEVGLPDGASWAVTVRNVSNSANSPGPIAFSEQAGAYGFSSGAAGGYIIVTPLHFTVGDGSLSIQVDFVPLNRVVWNETGLGPGLIWSVLVNGAALPDSGGWVVTHLFNGSHSFTIPGVQDYVPNPRLGTVDLTGSGTTIDVRFARATFSVKFAVTGLPTGAEYQVRLSNSSQQTALDAFGFEIPNGTYTFDVHPPAGYYPSPSHGTVTVRGSPTVIVIAILPIGPGPNPPTATLILSATTTAVALSLGGAGAFLLLGAIRRRRAQSSLA